MPATYEPIATTTTGGNTNPITFSSIPSGYTDLRLIVVASTDSSASGGSPNFQFNSDTGANYAHLVFDGNRTSTAQVLTTGATSISFYAATPSTLTYPLFATIDIFGYTSSSFKTAVISYNYDQNTSGRAGYFIGLWRSTSAITRIDLNMPSGNFYTNSTATLYGIKAA